MLLPTRLRCHRRRRSRSCFVLLVLLGEQTELIDPSRTNLIDDGNDVEWQLGPSRVVEVGNGKKFARVTGVQSVEQSQGHIDGLNDTAESTLGINDKEHLDDGTMWPVAYALKELTAADEARIAALVRKAAD